MFQIQQCLKSADFKRQGTEGEKWNKNREKTQSVWDCYCEVGINTQIDNPSELQGRTRHAYMEPRMVRPDDEDLRDSILSIA